MGSNHEVAGQTAIITGAGSGIGAATAILMTFVVGGSTWMRTPIVSA